MKDSPLARLAHLAAMKRDADLQDLRQIAARMQSLQGEIDRLRTTARTREQDLALDPARLTGADVVWQRWVAATITAHQSQMAELALARELLLARARLSFGRADVLAQVEARARKPRPGT